jgi:hypothetical protein
MRHHSKNKSRTGRRPQTPRATKAVRKPSEDAIRTRAFEIYARRHGVGGSQVADWLQAERELTR